MEIHGLMPRHPSRDYEIPVSRDYKLVVPCENIGCPINKSNFCSFPSTIKISSGGYCKTGRDLIEELKKNKKKEENKGFYKHEGD